MALFVIISPSISKKRAKGMFEAPDEATFQQVKTIEEEGAAVILTPHFTLSELIVATPLLFPSFKNKTSVIFRPLNDPKLNAWVTESRSRFGMDLLSRRNGYTQALTQLEDGNVVGLLFDQNASGKGSMIHFFDRIASSTELPGLLVHKKKVPCYVTWAERTAFFKARVRIQEIATGDSPIHVTLAANEWLENYLGSSDDRCADWLWLHDRWGSPQNPKRRFQLKNKRNRLAEEAVFRKHQPNKRVVALWILLPTDIASFKDLPSILRAIHAARPDYSLRLISSHPETSLRQHFGNLPDRIVESACDLNQIETFKQIAQEYPDIWINLQTSRTSLKLSQATAAHQRFGIETVRNARKYMTHLGPASDDSWMPFFSRFGLLPFDQEDAAS